MLAVCLMVAGQLSPDLAPVPPEYLPTQAALSALAPGVGHLFAGDPAGAGLTAAFFYIPIGLDAGQKPDATRGRLLESSLWGVYAYQVYDAHQAARARTGNAGYPQPFVRRNMAELLVAPFDPARLSDGRIWLGLGLQALVTGGLMAAFKFSPALTGPRYVFQARSASLSTGQSLTPGQAYGFNLAAASVGFAGVGAYEEALFRGVVQTELERPLGPEWGNLAASALFAGYHLPDSVWGFLMLGSAGYVFGRLYQAADYDLAVPAAAHAYADIGITAIAGLWPKNTEGVWGGYSNPLGIKFQF